MKFHPLEAELFHAGEQADMMKLRVAFGILAGAPENYTSCPQGVVMCFVWILPRQRRSTCVV
jgi:hypothetical protein